MSGFVLGEKRIIYLIPAIIWMIVIFSLSSQTGRVSSGESSFIVKAIMTVFVPDFDNWDMGQKAEIGNILEVAIRKLAHATEFAILELLLIFGIYKGRLIKNIKKVILGSSAIAVLYACSDEIHQLFVPGRSGQLKDVGIDFFGICLVAGIAFYLSFNKHMRNNN